MKSTNDNYVGYKVRLFPTKNQIKEFNGYFSMSRFVYNLCIDLQEKQYKKYLDYKEHPENYSERIYRRISAYQLSSIIIELKNTDKYSWLNKYNVESIRGIIRDCCMGYKRHDTHINHERPKYKSKIYSKKQFYTRHDRLTISNNTITLSSIGKIKYYNSYGNEIIGDGNKNKKNHINYYNPRISYDGINFYLSFTIIKDHKHQVNSYHKYYGNEEWNNKEYSEPIGIDVGLRNNKWFVDSTGTVIQRPDSSVLNKKISRLQRKYNRQKSSNIKKNSSFLEQYPNGSKNMQKTLSKINKCFKKINNRRKNTIHEYACNLLDKKPRAIVMESIYPKEMSNNFSSYGNIQNKLHYMIIDASLYQSMQIIEQKMTNNRIPVIRADKDYPSSQLCSCCGYRQDIGRRKIYICPKCGTIIDRDLNASINLKNLAYSNY